MSQHARRFHRARQLVAASAAAAVAAAFALPLTASAREAQQAAESTETDLVAAITALSEAGFTPTQIRTMMASRGGGSSDELPPADRVVEGLEKVSNGEGQLFSVYYAADPAAKQPGELYAEIPQSLLGQDLLLATTVGSGPFAGFQWSDYLVRLERRGQRIAVMVPDLANRGGGTVGEAVQRTYRDAILVTLPIRAQSGGGLVVDMTPLTLGNVVRVPGGGFGADPSLSRHTKVKVFPENVLIEAERVAGGGVPTLVSYSFRRLPQRTNYRPRVADERVGYFQSAAQDWGKPVNARETLDRFIHRWNVEKLDPSLEMSPPAEPVVFYIEKTVPVRWRKYVEEGIEEWNKAFEEVGIQGAIEVRQQTDTAYGDLDPEDARYNFLRWIVSGRAFAMGPSRVDPRTGQILDADIIFDDSMLRYFQADLDLLGPKSVARDFSGEQISFWRDHPEFRPMGVTAADVENAASIVADQTGLFSVSGSNMNPAEDPNLGRDAREHAAAHVGATLADGPVASRSAGHSGLCNHAVGIRQQLAVAQLSRLAAEMPSTRPSVDVDLPGEDVEPGVISGETADADNIADEMEEAVESIEEAGEEIADVVEEVAEEATTVSKQPLPDKFLGLILKEIVAHEVGHTLGLRHNFKASAWLSLDEIKARRGDADEPTTASVMDYNPTLLFAGDDPEQVETFISPVLGPYDTWAIEYGYKILPRRQELKLLKEIASKSGQPELAYATDEDTVGPLSPDPLVNRYDMGNDPVAWAKSRIELAESMMPTVEEWSQADDERSEFLRRAFLTLWFEKAGAMQYVARQVGGQSFSRARPGDEIAEGEPQPGLTPLPAERQREALAFLSETVFADGFFDVEAGLMHRIHSDRLPGLGNWPSPRVDFPAHDVILRAQTIALSTLTDPNVLQRVYDAEIKGRRGGNDDKEIFTAVEVLDGVTDAVWTDLDKEIPSTRRNLQQQHLKSLLAMADSEPGRLMSADLRNLVRHEARQLADRLEKVADKADGPTAAHLFESREQIERVLNAPHMKGGGNSGPVLLMLGQEAE